MAASFEAHVEALSEDAVGNFLWPGGLTETTLAEQAHVTSPPFLIAHPLAQSALAYPVFI